ncbi:XdhC family protein [Limnochorda pilosa]|uniref:Xanthine dehydrogenase n=1 Tax=Limnochorda pilosa TaxID=1555112 RepID=A0A0K2SJG6_LIMPI|nr:XdhC family protein [Limnochorda pilosa]BAS26999.1 xanthine dehydrogenase [Limnochorda pilosa]
MSHPLETLDVLREALRAQEAGQPVAMATVVGIEGSGYRHEGARLLIRPDGTTCGTLSGGCLEGDVAEIARQVVAEGRPRLVTYDLTHDEDGLWGLGMGCNGVVQILIEPVAAAPAAGSPPPAGA